MNLYAVTREAGSAWLPGRGAFDQPDVNLHAGFMNELADDGFVLFAGPLAGSEGDRIRALVIINAPNETDIQRRLADDPWAQADRIVTTSVEPWTLFVGAERLPASVTQ